MHALDWLVVVGYLAWVVADGLKRAGSIREIEGYFLAHRSLPWWVVGLSVMATQMSAITLVSTTGQGYADGMRFVQMYLGLPVAMVILSLTLVPFFHRARVLTAYEVLERRFTVRTRLATSLLFLLSRGLSCGVIVAAPAVILSIVLDWNLGVTVLAIGLPTTLYTLLGGVAAVAWTDVKQMVVILLGISAVVAVLIAGLPDAVSLDAALHLAGAVGRIRTLDFSFSLHEKYTFWSGLIGGLFLMLSYFGCDQSQVQRYLTASSVDAGRRSLLMSAFAKIPLQALILLVGVLMFSFYCFNPPPLRFNPSHAALVRSSERAGEYAKLEAAFAAGYERRREAALALAGGADPGARAAFLDADQELVELRAQAAELVKEVSHDKATSEVNYVFPTFIVSQLPRGLVGLLIAAIFAAAMSSIAAELNALASISVLDIYRRHVRPTASDAHYVAASRVATLFWGLLACGVAGFAARLGSLIEVVNRLGSLFYGSLLGVFVLAFAFPSATAGGALAGLACGMTAVGLVAWLTDISFLWHNVVGVGVVVGVGLLVSVIAPAAPSQRDAGGDALSAP